ncbi:hypothetical protein UAJ10_00140 [Nitrospirillum sp. BR 11164]|uniref:hypothetical protein n=1 Tax=Nitrospirillum sp. BR 11164 TaxID=3104324 RepID=UPI002AFE9525|nr:hypothetical protein [Nitrospirillum sp. BR 11164]MEA1647423.1 hypothetical protein [Nitrospirillum sp. BR 11164]
MKKAAGILIASVILGWCPAVQAGDANGDFARKIAGRGTIQIRGWARLRGELMIFDSTASRDGKVSFPHCISGVFTNQAAIDLSFFDGKLVQVTGQIFKYDDLKLEDSPLLPRKTLAGSIVPNFCFGSNVLLIESLELSPQSPTP